jgi:hypothetical protein
MNRTTLILIATAATTPLAAFHPLAAQARSTAVTWSALEPVPTTVSSGVVKVALNPGVSDWNAVIFSRKSPATPWQQTYYQMKSITFSGGGTLWITSKVGPTSTLATDVRIRKSKVLFLEYPLGVITAPPTATPVASVTQRGGSTVALGNFESVAMGNFEGAQVTGIWSGLDSVVKTNPSLRDLSLNEISASPASTKMARLEAGQAVFLDGGRRLVVVADRLVLMSGTQSQRSWPVASSWVMKTGDQLISVLEKVGYAK